MRKSIIIFCLLLLGVQARADELYKVKEGDTLWDICEEYYHDPFLWPKLWQINPQLTNPHWIYPGDILLLKETPEELIKAAEKKEATLPKKKGKFITLDKSFIEAAGYLLPYREKHSGEIIKAVGEERTILGKDDKIFIKFAADIKPQVGSTWTIFRISDLIKHPVTGKPIGYIHEILGVAKITKVYPQVAQARIETSYDVIYRGDYLKPYKPTKSIVVYKESAYTKPRQKAFIITCRNRISEIGAPEAVYIDIGENQNVKIGQILKVFRQEREDLPLLPVGEILIIYTTPGTATAMVLKSQYPFHPGDIVK